MQHAMVDQKAHQAIGVYVGANALILACHRCVIAAPELAMEQLHNKEVRTSYLLRAKHAEHM
jgi:O6-methylguanine-DNA--protein-cysteine methyltransferase